MKKIFFSIAITALVALAILSACNKDHDIAQITTKTIKGAAQKGPFLNGSSITVYELDQNYAQTGKSFATQITDNLGNFQINSATLNSNYISIRADGFYFNEVCGSNSVSQITLNGISAISGTAPLHINILTHLEKQRVEYLLGTGLSFDSAKKVAQSDVLNIFNISSNGIQNSEYLDISNSGNGDAVLLAISSILQGFRTESELSSTLSSISNDIKSDGVLNSTAIMSSLIDHAILLDTIAIRNNITNYYLNNGISPSIPHFEYYIKQFVENSTFIITNSVITYPATGLYGDNILARSQLVYNGSFFSMNPVLKRCSQFTVRMHVINGSGWAYKLGTNNNWNITDYNSTNEEQFFTVIDPEQPSDLGLQIPPGGTYLIEYFEINSLTPSYSKTITVN